MSKPLPPEEDDGRVVAEMNVEGMPWYVEKRQSDDAPDTGVGRPRTEFSKEEARAYRRGALKAAFIVTAIFGLAGFLFIAFCLYVWLA